MLPPGQAGLPWHGFGFRPAPPQADNRRLWQQLSTIAPPTELCRRHKRTTRRRSFLQCSNDIRAAHRRQDPRHAISGARRLTARQQDRAEPARSGCDARSSIRWSIGATAKRMLKNDALAPKKGALPYCEMCLSDGRISRAAIACNRDPADRGNFPLRAGLHRPVNRPHTDTMRQQSIN